MLTELRKRMKMIKTCNLYLGLFTLGMAISLTGPCLLDLQHMVRTDTQQIALIYTARSIGYLVGAILGGVLLDVVKCKMSVLTGCYFFVAATNIGIPWSRSVETLMGFMVINGLSLGAIETGGNVICLQLWGKDSNPVFQGLHFTFGLGGLISPLLAAPFLDNFKGVPTASDNATYFDEPFHNSTVNFWSNDTNAENSLPRIIYPFSCLGVFGVLVATLNLAATIVSPTEGDVIEDGKTDNSQRSWLFMVATVVFMFLLFFVIAGTEIGYGQSLTTYAVKGKLHTSKTTGSYMTSAFWASFTVSRLLGVFLALKISCLKLLIGDICVVSISALILLFLMPNEWALWLASVVFGTGIASGYAAGVGWIGYHIIITNKISAIFTVGCAAGEMVVPFVITYFIEIFPEMFAFVTASSCILTIVLLFILHCIFKYGKKTKTQPKTNDCYVIDVNSKQI